ncbi:hypothetical protein CC86DRAFT_287097 [Ophiobolus disseminans]|uniref:P-loop containing nucleoside triphosphate hydrolase protein n=1 Tax=Ophiobolus disseminans TaxID=1469910 RepID=A0A6A7AA13_9PLEO|nr:hypothetical protein CC86DRAFT_287097 [Ophiobolus disseminans]
MSVEGLPDDVEAPTTRSLAGTQGDHAQGATQVGIQENVPGDSQGGAQEDISDGDQEDTADDIEEDVIEADHENAQEADPRHGFQQTSVELDEDLDEDGEDDQDAVFESIEQELGLEAGSLNPVADDISTAEQDEESEEQDDETMDDEQPESEHVPTRLQEITEPQDEAKPMDGVQDESNVNGEEESLGEQPQEGSNFQPTQVEEEQLDNDPSSLFVSERATPAPQPPTRHQTSASMGPPPRPTKASSNAGISTFAKLRNMQKRLEETRNAAKKQATTYSNHADPDNEAYLEAILLPITPPSSTPKPEVDGDEMADRLAQAEFQRLQRHYNELKRKNGSLTFRQDVEWMKVKGANEARKSKRRRDLAKAQDDQEGDTELFPDARPRNDDNDDREEESDDAFGFDKSPDSRKRRRRDLPRKEPKQMSMQEAELQSMKVALEASEDLPKKKRKKAPAADDSSQEAPSSGKGKASKPKSKTTKSKAAPKKPATGTRKTAKGRREVDHAVKQASSLFNSNVFEQQAGPGEAEQPTFRSRNKQDALKELIASVPLDDRQQARSDMSVLLAATKDFDGRGSVKAAGGNWLVRGMSTSLKGYQILGSAFMRRRENAAEEPLGGLMADQMGLGKTLMMLANIVNGQPGKGQQPRTTLLVAGPALLGQWAKEIEQHTNCGLRVMRYGAGTRIDSNHAYDILKGHDIILTTYSEVMKSYPKNEPPIECQTAEQKMTWWKSVYDQQRGVLHRMQFLRIVLDEAQAIKNHMGRTSIACRALMAKHKWALSGTPILNSLTELYPYFKFLGVPHTGSFKIFKHNYCDTKDIENTERLLVRLSQFMIRRTHADRMFNAPILKLPQADQATFWCEFNPVERCIYEIVHQRFAKNINLWQKKGVLEKSYGNVLVMLLRLRQLTAHVLMLQFVMRDILEVEDIERIKEVVNEEAVDSSTRHGSTIIAIRKQLEKHAIDEKQKAAAKAKAAAEAKAAGKEAEDIADEEDNSGEAEPEMEPEEEEEEARQSTGQAGAGLGGSGRNFGKEYNFKPFLKSLKTGESWEKAKKKARCSWCNKQPTHPYIAGCGHLICLDPCLELSSTSAAEVGKAEAPCKTCGITSKAYIPFEAEQDDPIYGVAESTRSKSGAKAAKQRERRDREEIKDDWLAMVGHDVLPSAKTLAIKAQILNWRKEDPKVKIIIYTQFLAMVKIMAKIFQLEGWPLTSPQYVGTMSLPAREKAITTFADNSNVNILLASLRCGGLGLNLTMASRVIMVDPWWNGASEQQAFCRVFRIGQKEETYMSRFCVSNTVDARLIAMQERKQQEINEVMEDDGTRVKKMSIPDLMRLFGNLDEDANGKPFIMVDNPDPRGGFRADRDDEGYADEF